MSGEGRKTLKEYPEKLKGPIADPEKSFGLRLLA